jgi:hypothetical protein
MINECETCLAATDTKIVEAWQVASMPLFSCMQQNIKLVAKRSEHYLYSGIQFWCASPDESGYTFQVKDGM